LAIFGPFFGKIPGGGPGNGKKAIFECGVYIGQKTRFFPKVYKMTPFLGPPRDFTPKTMDFALKSVKMAIF
jgi:hypothetical protein